MVIDNNSIIKLYHTENFNLKNLNIDKLYQRCKEQNRIINLCAETIVSKKLTISVYIDKLNQ
jgi:hypothetical protein